MSNKEKVGVSDFPKTCDTLRKEPHISIYQMIDYLRFLQGVWLTVIDATFTEKEQRKAMKDLVTNQIWSSFDKVEKWVFDQHKDDCVLRFPFENNEAPKPLPQHLRNESGGTN